MHDAFTLVCNIKSQCRKGRFTYITDFQSRGFCLETAMIVKMMTAMTVVA